MKQSKDEALNKGTFRAPLRCGFTLIELLVVVLIIGVLAAIALPMYQKAVLKSRFAALMPIGKAMADSNEAYYLEHNAYASNPQDLLVQGQKDYDDGTSVDLVSTENYIYTIVYNEDKLPDHNYIVFQKHSAKFADTTMCEARDEEAGKVCVAMGGTPVEGEGSITPDWIPYLLSGTQGGSYFVVPCPDNSVCNEENEITSCTNGYTLKNGSCAECDIANAAACSATSYKATSCQNGLCVKDGACVSCDCISQWCSSPQLAIGAGGGCRYSGTWSDTCAGSSFNANATCDGGRCSSSATYGITTFTDNASCKGEGSCGGAEFYGNSGCAGNSQCTPTNGYTTTFTDNATCKDTAHCAGAVFSGNSTCTSTYDASGYLGCSSTKISYNNGEPMMLISTFKDNAVCGGTGCDTANYEGNACCSSCSVGSGKPKCGGGVW